MTDRYDRAIAYFTKNPKRIAISWFSSSSRAYFEPGYLFAYASKDPYNAGRNTDLGCLTMIRYDSSIFKAETQALTDEIASDTRLPKDPDDITVENLHVFAEWQRRLDKELNRVW